MLIVFSGLPGSGKTTIARALASHLRATYLRIDSIEQALRNGGLAEVGKAGYEVANALARSNLALGNRVVADCVNPLAESRQAWQGIAKAEQSPLLNVEVICTDIAEHRRRVESREADVPGLRPPSWQSVLDHDYQAWSGERLTLDSAVLAPAEAVRIILEHLETL
ncbi:AAA family ATPase [Pseudomonas chlororaphis]|uniref:AAA family ATPase n=1 Tax=Pseudomonas chlororaphis TaxID=587753 RepID=UPI001926A5A6|nr:AAA family ATPase [Pseudomonas chlororaphis]QQX61199.1 AAA family ATPase [Pseudomonas chlororaphis subsp. aurantiaca]UVE47995.1 AAA family ATPase [Pseudomonas chlororaphis]